MPFTNAASDDLEAYRKGKVTADQLLRPEAKTTLAKDLPNLPKPKKNGNGNGFKGRQPRERGNFTP
jgi:hypothetical protein